MSRPGVFAANLIVLILVAPPVDAVRLSALQRRILRLVALGCDDGQIARILGRSIAAVSRHKARALERLGTSSRRKIARWARREGVTYAGDQLSPSERAAAGLSDSL
jgi:DNA-binding CsgD family transcriptional regulator